MQVVAAVPEVAVASGSAVEEEVTRKRTLSFHNTVEDSTATQCVALLKGSLQAVQRITYIHMVVSILV